MNVTSLESSEAATMLCKALISACQKPYTMIFSPPECVVNDSVPWSTILLIVLFGLTNILVLGVVIVERMQSPRGPQYINCTLPLVCILTWHFPARSPLSWGRLILH